MEPSAQMEQTYSKNVNGLMIAAPNSGSGKTTLTLALLRALNRQGFATRSYKAGPDYIDPKFHHAATGQPCYNLDPWAMKPSLMEGLIADSQDVPFIVEAMMGLFDGADGGRASSAHLAKQFNLPIILVLDCAKTSHSIAATLYGFKEFDKALNIAGVILNRVGSQRHEAMLRDAIAPLGVKIFGAINRNPALDLPDRHLGLIPAGEHPALDEFLNQAASVIEKSIDLDAIKNLLLGDERKSQNLNKNLIKNSIPSLGKHIAIARDEAFCFAYPHLLNAWQNEGAKLSFFSPLKDEMPDGKCDAIYLPGGYPELHCKNLSKAQNFKLAMQNQAQKGTLIYGECGGYMTLGKSIIDAKGEVFSMLGLLDLVTSFETRKLHLGYRQLEISTKNQWINRLTNPVMAHEFHYATIVEENCDTSLFKAKDSQGNHLGDFGMVKNNVMGSFMHLIDGEQID